MAQEPTLSKSGRMLSLYANLLDPSADSASTPGTTISRAPVVFKQSSEGDQTADDPNGKKQQLNAASLRFQPTKRPQLSAQKPKPKPALPKTATSGTASPAASATSTAHAAAAAAAAAKTSLADWTNTEDDDVNGFYVGEKRQRGGRKKRKKNRHDMRTMIQNWDDIYDPSRPNHYEEYRHSDEKIAEVREWKDRLYAHRMIRSRSEASDSDGEYSRPTMNRRFAPPPSFAPPPNLNEVPPPPPPPATVPDDASGEDAYTRRLRMSQAQEKPDYSPTFVGEQPPPPPPAEHAVPPSRPLDALQPSSATISRAPVRYALPPPPEDIPASEAELEQVLANEQSADEDGEAEDNADAPRSLRPGQTGFAQRLLEKYGWTKGSGLGATGSGIVKPLQVKVEKQKKRPDAEGGGFVTPGGRGKIIGSAKKAEDEGKFGPMSEVIVLKGMLDGMDLDVELEGDQDGGLMQEIGEECSEKYGRVERVYVHRDASPPVPVFVKFTSQLSALRAVNALEGRIFNGNAITARFYDKDKFEKGVFNE